MDDKHQIFLRRLEKSHKWVRRAGAWFKSRGYRVYVPPPPEPAPTHDKWKEHRDQGDLFIAQRIEVKHLEKTDFTNREDWPFSPYFIVCNANAFRMARPRPYAFLYINRAGTHAACVMTSTKDRWYEQERYDRELRHTQMCLFCPLDLVQFFPFVIDS